ncbi:FMN reductase [soil metagenome]
MHTANIVSFIGSAQRPSKTRQLAGMVSDRVIAGTGYDAITYDLLDVGAALGSFSRSGISQQAEQVLHAIESADALIVGSPVYKGSYAGHFKHVFDLIDPAALAGKPVAIVSTGGGPRHALVVEHQFRPLFGFFCARSMPTTVYACAEDFGADGQMEGGVLARIDNLAAELRSTLLSMVPA